MKLLVGMNLSPRWIGLLNNSGVDAVHWSIIGKDNAPEGTRGRNPIILNRFVPQAASLPC